MRRRFVLSVLAARDLAEIVTHVRAEGGIRQAKRVLRELQGAMLRAADLPHSGHRREDLTGADVRFLSVWSYLIVYRPGKSPIEIARVLHGARDIPTLLSDL